ncbi:MAG: hypothetical protein DMH00_08060 [Acidobacteria bacterium]|nr:MAG: hypothetical protein DMH00_08060 [Acidobacteriota bacterium]
MTKSLSGARHALAFAVLLICSALGSTSRALPADSSSPPDVTRLSPRLLRLAEAGTQQAVPVVVMTAAPAGDSEVTEAQSIGAMVGRRFGKLSGYVATVPAGALRRLAHARGVIGIAYDGEVRGSNDLNYGTVGADRAARETFNGVPGLDGSGVTVAVVDSGVAPHPDLAGRLLAAVDFASHEKGFVDPYGHGTHVAGIIAGDGTASGDSGSFRKFNGIAPGARIVSVRVLDELGGGKVSDVLAGIDWVLAHKDAYAIRIMNLSLGHPVEEPCAGDPLCRAVEAAWSAGILVVAAAGNAGAEGYGTIHSPGNDPAILTVGASNNYLSATRFDDILTSYTSRGPTPLDHVVKPDLVAPGNRTISLRVVGSTLDEAYPSLRVKEGAFRQDPTAAGDDSLYFQMSGSSMAAGVVSGMAALMMQADPSLSPDTLKARLMKSAEKRLVYDAFSEGAGFADLLSALQESAIATLPALSPRAECADSGMVLQDTGSLWGSADDWSLSSIFGVDPLRGTGGVWADAALWSDVVSGAAPSGVSGHSIVWGGGMKSSGSASGTSFVGSTSIVWGGGHNSSGSTTGTSTVGADSIVWGGGLKSSGAAPGSSTVGADSIVWGGGLKPAMDTSISGDNIPQRP